MEHHLLEVMRKNCDKEKIIMTKAVVRALNLLLAVICFIAGMIFVLFALLGNSNGYYLVLVGMPLLFLASICAAGASIDLERLVG